MCVCGRRKEKVGSIRATWRASFGFYIALSMLDGGRMFLNFKTLKLLTRVEKE